MGFNIAVVKCRCSLSNQLSFCDATIGSLQNDFSIAKSISPRQSDTTFFACWQVQQILAVYSGYRWWWYLIIQSFNHLITLFLTIRCFFSFSDSWANKPSKWEQINTPACDHVFTLPAFERNWMIFVQKNRKHSDQDIF